MGPQKGGITLSCGLLLPAKVIFLPPPRILIPGELASSASATASPLLCVIDALDLRVLEVASLVVLLFSLRSSWLNIDAAFCSFNAGRCREGVDSDEKPEGVVLRKREGGMAGWTFPPAAVRLCSCMILSCCFEATIESVNRSSSFHKEAVVLGRSELPN